MKSQKRNNIPKRMKSTSSPSRQTGGQLLTGSPSGTKRDKENKDHSKANRYIGRVRNDTNPMESE
jgi:hypothetical protein